jgi:hypothetical protein
MDGWVCIYGSLSIEPAVWAAFARARDWAHHRACFYFLVELVQRNFL